mmetsp:Transcript_80839/g.133571  ORF Transcript_80839/g.133571 Transcript_80839/m.133571 type:complete len:103 (+) Transcript_80839:39-347(+)
MSYEQIFHKLVRQKGQVPILIKHSVHTRRLDPSRPQQGITLVGAWASKQIAHSSPDLSTEASRPAVPAAAALASAMSCMRIRMAFASSSAERPAMRPISMAV